MWRVIWFFLGVTRLQVTGASPEWCLQRLAKARVPFHFCGKPDAFTAGIWILRRDEARVTRLVRAAGTGDDIVGAGAVPDEGGGGLQQDVAGGVSEMVVDELEAVHVAVDDA